MSRNKYGAKSLTMRKADSMRNPAYVSLPKGSMKNKSLLSTLARAADAGIGRYSVRNEKPSAMLSMKTIDRLAESISPLVLMQMFKDKVRPAKTTKRMSSVRKADYFVNNAPSKTPPKSNSSKPSTYSSRYAPMQTSTPTPTPPVKIPSYKPVDEPDFMRNFDFSTSTPAQSQRSYNPQSTAIPTQPPTPKPSTPPPYISTQSFTPTPSGYSPYFQPVDEPDVMRNFDFSRLTPNAAQTAQRLYSPSSTATPYPTATAMVKRKASTKRKSSVRKADSMRNPAYISLPKGPMKTSSFFGRIINELKRPSKASQDKLLNDSINYQFDMMNRYPYLQEMRRKAIEEGRIPLDTYSYPSSSGDGLPNTLPTPTRVIKRKSSVRKANSTSNPSKRTSFFKADSMRNPEYVDIERAPAVERMSDKVRARVNRTIGSNPLESVLEILQGKDTRNMINAQRNRNDYYRRKGDEISANYAREKRIPEYTRLPKGSAVPNMAMRAKEALNRIGAGTPDPAQKLMAILQSPSVIARFFDESQGKGKGKGIK